jgi:AAA+ superfamily predicted ATPase
VSLQQAQDRWRLGRWAGVGDVSEPLIASLLAAVSAQPDDVALRLHTAQLLAAAGRAPEAVQQAAALLQRDPTNQAALELIRRAGAPESPPGLPDAPQEPPPDSAAGSGFDWRAAESEVEGLVPPMFVGADGGGEPAEEIGDAYDVERPELRLVDVGGMVEVKARLEAAFLTPMRNPELRAAFAKSLKGGLMLYGPPGCGKTFLARALAGELGAAFVNVAFSDVLDMYLGQSERNLHETFQTARRHAPCVLFLDEVDAIGQKRSLLRHSAMRGTVNQLLVELDDVVGANEGVFVLAATNAPWDVDPALRRPGRLDRTLLVLPPDAEARHTIIRYHLRERPIAAIDVTKIVKATDGFSGADLAHVCDVAAERALMDSVNSGQIRLIGMGDMEAALKEVRPSTGPWFDMAKNVAQFANEGGTYDDLLRYLKAKRLL